MNYKSQLRGWAFDRAIEAAKVSGDKADMALLMKSAEELAEWSYIPDKDFDDAVQHLAELIKDVENGPDRVRQLILELNAIQEDMERQSAMRATVTEVQ